MTDVCLKCEFRELCEFLEYPMECADVNGCEHYDSFLDGKAQAEEAYWDVE